MIENPKSGFSSAVLTVLTLPFDDRIIRCEQVSTRLFSAGKMECIGRINSPGCKILIPADYIFVNRNPLFGYGVIF
jgi:hypothetical protein